MSRNINCRVDLEGQQPVVCLSCPCIDDENHDRACYSEFHVMFSRQWNSLPSEVTSVIEGYMCDTSVYAQPHKCVVGVLSV